MGMMPFMRYDRTRCGRFVNGATRTMPAKSRGVDGLVMTISSLFSVFPAVAGRSFSGRRLASDKPDGPLAKCSATALATAVPRLWPSSTMREEGILATSRAQLTAAMPSAIRPASLGSPLEEPKPR